MKADKVLKTIEDKARSVGWPIIGPLKGSVLVNAIKKYQPKKILEVGTLVGYSSILMAKYLKKGGVITCVEVSSELAKEAKENIKKAGFKNKIKVITGDAISVIPKLRKKFDLLFLDAAKKEYLQYLRRAEKKLSSHAVVIADNVGIFSKDMNDYITYVGLNPKYKSKIIDFGFDAVEISLLNN